MKKYETIIVKLHNETPQEQVEKALNGWGAKGYRLVHVNESFGIGDSFKDYYDYILQREIDA